MNNHKHIYNTLIVEDEPIFVEQLSQYIAQVNFLAPPMVCTFGVDALHILGTKPVDVLFLDLSLPDMTGLDLLRAIQNPPAILVTSTYSERAIDCFDLDIIDFLPKPYDFNRFLRGLTRVLKRTQSAPVVDIIPTANLEKDEIYFKSGRRLERFAFNDILHIEAYGIYSKLHTFDGTFAVNKRISVLAQELPPNRFLRIHKSYIVNVAHLKRLEAKQLWIKTTKLPIGVTYQPVVHDFMKALGISEK
ncbi:LytR/AlgR family response regulator transcription factor [Spirosoma aerophilum]